MDDTSQKDIQDSLILFEKDFQLEKSYLALEQQTRYTYDQAYLKILRVVEDLLARDLNALLNILYIIDVSEELLKKALAKSEDNTAAIITDMIFKRALQKVETRKKYS